MGRGEREEVDTLEGAREEGREEVGGGRRDGSGRGGGGMSRDEVGSWESLGGPRGVVVKGEVGEGEIEGLLIEAVWEATL